jgi:hypothetical protein
VDNTTKVLKDVSGFLAHMATTYVKSESKVNGPISTDQRKSLIIKDVAEYVSIMSGVGLCGINDNSSQGRSIGSWSQAFSSVNLNENGDNNVLKDLAEFLNVVASSPQDVMSNNGYKNSTDNKFVQGMANYVSLITDRKNQTKRGIKPKRSTFFEIMNFSPIAEKGPHTNTNVNVPINEGMVNPLDDLIQSPTFDISHNGLTPKVNTAINPAMTFHPGNTHVAD